MEKYIPGPLFQYVGIFVASDAAEICGDVWLFQEPLSDSHSVLHAAAGNKFGIVFIH